MTDIKIPYAPQFKAIHNCLVEVREGPNGQSQRKLCNFTPWITAELILDDGLESNTHITLEGIHESDRRLPPIRIPGSELASFHWLPRYWGMDCILEIGQNVREAVRYAIQTTASAAQRQHLYSVTGWMQIGGQWQFLMPGQADTAVQLPRKLEGYTMEPRCNPADIQTAACLLDHPPAPEAILFPMLALAFLSPLNHFLKLGGHEPKFVLFLIGRSGSRKSSLAALILSFFGWFHSGLLPLSFRDTANSILTNAFSLKDVLTCIDDYHPAAGPQKAILTETAQSIMRGYGDRVGKGRLRSDSTVMDARPPQGNAILTGETAPEIGESGTARYFELHLHPGEVDLELLSAFQQEAERGTLRRCMYAYLCWLRDSFLS